MRSSYNINDVELLLKDITGLVEPQPTEEREKLIQQGKHYSEMLPIEYVPTEKYMQIYEESLQQFAKVNAKAIGILSDKIISQKGKDVVLVSLARAGIPAGILIKRYIQKKYNFEVKHYSISIIRGRGIDKNAINYILKRYKANQIVFVDGWIGKGAILKELKKDVLEFEGLSSELAVIADPAGVSSLYGTREDILIPSSCLNSTVSGLISRTFLREDIIKKNDFHGAVYYENLENSDLSYEFIEAIEKEFVFSDCVQEKEIIYNKYRYGKDEVEAIAKEYGIDDINLVKPGIGETTRVLLRRVPWKILIDEKVKDEPELSALKRLAKEKNVPVEFHPLEHYKACGIIKKLADA
ncbi:cysteine protease StiP family protein [Lachnobacterium bovis]|uniref:PELOTA RNA binding domain-containing protein n=1 Tax=Lachnobacterium bovis TaxID=140626 RepID=A0A1H9RRE5_9FIRM|nr:cysteine protease StiP family protein [Lachnobacterium bovis]SER75154.1 PELOTA RNA binding domain-containing protein [Lachnobacterium bovis]